MVASGLGTRAWGGELVGSSMRKDGSLLANASLTSLANTVLPSCALSLNVGTSKAGKGGVLLFRLR
jgi:hypothetical protein